MSSDDFKQIVSNPGILGGKPCVKGTRISVEHVLELIASGASRDDVVSMYPHVPAAGIQEAILYARRFLQNDIVIEVEAAH